MKYMGRDIETTVRTDGTGRKYINGTIIKISKMKPHAILEDTVNTKINIPELMNKITNS